MNGRSADTSAPRESAVYCGDAFDLIEKLPEASVDLIVTSPPYWCQRVYAGQEDHNWAVQDAWRREGESLDVAPPYDWYRANGGMLGLEPTPDWYVAHLAEWFDRARPVLKPGGSVWVNIGDTYFARWASIRPEGRQGLGDTRRVRRRTPMGGYRQEKQLLMVPARFAIAMQGRRWILRNDLIWSKPNVPPRPEKDRLRLTHEHLFHFVHRPREGRASYFYDLNEAESGGRDVVTVNARSGAHGHSATFPPELIRPRVLSSSPVGGVVLDPFCGTGRALTIAVENERTAIGFEMGEAFAEVAAQNLAAAVQRSTSTLDHGLLNEVARRLFDVSVDADALIVAAVTLDEPATRSRIRVALDAGAPVFVYFRARLGGELSLSRTDRSPEFSFDITMVELLPGSGDPGIGRYAIVEVQTMEFHGSYGQATTALRNALDLHQSSFAEQVGGNPEWAGRAIQGPSIADTFKRTFYQMIFKFQLSLHASCAGTVLALPRAVWNSWQPHLGGPDLQGDPLDPKLRSLPRPDGVALTEEATAWILVFDTDQTVGTSPNPLVIDMVIETDTPALLHYAFDVAPEAALGGGATERLYADICSKMLGWWPELQRAAAADYAAPAQGTQDSEGDRFHVG